MNRCERIRKQLADYSVGGLGRRTRARITAHVQVCRACRAELAALERTEEVLDAVGLEKASDDWAMVRDQIMARARQRVRPLRRLTSGVAMAGLGLILLVAGGLLLAPNPPAVTPPVTAVTEADADLQATLEKHLSAVWASPLADEAAVGLRLTAVEEDG